MRSLETLTAIDHAKIVLQAMRERRFTSKELGIMRLDYPESDEKELNNYLTLTLENDGIHFGKMPTRYWGNMKEEYEEHNRDYRGVYCPET
jgi:hypothetical protein